MRLTWVYLALLSLTTLPAGAQSPPDQKEVDSFVRSMDAKNTAATPDPETLPGAAVYHAHCAQCHDGGIYKAPAKTFVQMMSADAIHNALTSGVMKVQATGLTEAQKRDVAEYLAGDTIEHAAKVAAPKLCTGEAARFDMTRPPRLTAWGLDASNSHHVPDAIGGLSAADIPSLKVKWAFAFPGAQRARSQPNFAMGAVYTGSQNGTVYALDAETGCVRWQFRATAEVRTPIVIPAWSVSDAGKARPVAYFGDIVGRAYAVDARTGKLLWKTKVDDHPSATITGAPVLHRSTLYVPVSSLEEAITDPKYACCTFRGSMVALDAQTGKVRWKTYTSPQTPTEVGRTASGTAIFAPSGAPIWSSPTVDEKRGVLYVGTGDNYSSPANDRSDAIIAFDLRTGEIRWHLQVFADDAWNVGCMIGTDMCPKPQGPDFDIGSGTTLVSLPSGKDVILAGLKSGAAIAVDPDSHQKLLWTQRLGRGGIQGGVQWGMATDGTRLFVPISDQINQGDHFPGEPQPGINAVDVGTGKVLWRTPAPDRCLGKQYCAPGIIAAITSAADTVFAGHMDGFLRAYAADTGKLVWEYDTNQPVTTVDGTTAHGGSMGGGGPVLYDGVLYVNSGYGIYFHLPGNVLYAFAPDRHH